MIVAATSIGLTLLSLIMIWWARQGEWWRKALDASASAAVFILFVIAASAVVDTIMDETVFMTAVHSVLLNPAFLASGAYLGGYTVARTALLAWKGQ